MNPLVNSVIVDAAIDTQHPWLGLASFTEDTRQYFYGREEEVGELSRRVQRKLLTVLFGQSGLGKTSILNAGIVPRLRPEGYCPVYVRVDYGTVALPPSEQIKQAIFRATEAQGTWTQSGSAAEGESLWEFLHHRDDELRDAEGKPIIPLLIFDQFEEIFTLAQADDGGRKRAAEFIEDLADLVENRPPKALEAKIDADDTVADRFDFGRADYRILISLREDYLAHLEGVKAAMPSITQNRMRLARMNGEQALAAVMKPGGKLVTQEVAESIVRFVAGGAELRNAEVEPSLLSLICRELNNARVAQRKAEISVDLIAGSNETILAEFYERSLADQPAAVRKVIEDDLLTDSGYRENLAEERVLKAFTNAEAKPDAATTLATLVNRRLLRIEERLDVRRVELTHDVLCGVVKASREERLEREALAEAEKNLEAQRARAAATKKALIRARQIAAGCAVLAVLAVGSGVVAYKAQREEVKTRMASEMSRGEAEKLLEFLLDDFLKEMEPMGRADIVASLAQRTFAYYEKLPTEARSTITQRNSAYAQITYAGALKVLGKQDEAQKLAEQAGVTIKALRAAGDNSDETLIAEATQLNMVAQILAVRGDVPAALPKIIEGLERLKPVLAKADPPRRAREREAALYGGLAFAYGGMSRPADALEAAQKCRTLSAQLGALDLTDLAATTQYVSAGGILGRGLIRLGKLTEAKAVLEADTALAEKLLTLRPGHRQALLVKGTMLAGLAQIEFEQLFMARRLAYLREALKVQQQRVALDAGTSVTQTALRGTQISLAVTLDFLGRLDEADQHYQQSLAIGRDERVDGAAAGSLAANHVYAAARLAQRGDLNGTKAELAQGDRYIVIAKAAGASERARVLGQAELNRVRGEIALATGGNVVEARRVIEREIVAVTTYLKGDKAVLVSTGSIFYLHSSAAELSLALGQYGEAEVHAREALAYRRPDTDATLDAQWPINEVRVKLAIALARQGKREEANQSLAPVQAYYRLPLVMTSDDKTLDGNRARVLFASALANPEKRVPLLAEATKKLNAMPPSLKRLNWAVRIRDEIATEMKK